MSKGLKWIEEVLSDEGLSILVELDYDKVAKSMGGPVAEKLLANSDAVQLVVENLTIAAVRMILYLGNKTQTNRERYLENVTSNGLLLPFISGVVEVEKSGLGIDAGVLLNFASQLYETRRTAPAGFDLVLDF